jgi:hypothetical protein
MLPFTWKTQSREHWGVKAQTALLSVVSTPGCVARENLYFSHPHNGVISPIPEGGKRIK